MPEEMVTLSKTELRKRAIGMSIESLGVGYALSSFVILISHKEGSMKHPLINIGIGLAIATVGILMKPQPPIIDLLTVGKK